MVPLRNSDAVCFVTFFVLLWSTLADDMTGRRHRYILPDAHTLPAADWNGFTEPGALIWGCRTLTRGAVLTFDDGPAGAQTIQLLDNLNELGVKATFFVVGVNAAAHPDIIKRMAAEGHEIGVHTWAHANMTHLQVSGLTAQMQQEVIDTENLIFNLTGRRPVLFRPPYGALNDGVRAFLASRGYTIVFWTGGCIDWWLHNPQQESPIVVNSMADAGGLVCMHDSSLETCQGIATLVNMLTIGEDVVANPQGRRIITMQECLVSHR